MSCLDPISAFIGGIGSGKTMAGVVKALYFADLLGGLGMIVAPTYTMLRDATLRTFREVAGRAVTDFYVHEMRAVLAGGTEVLFRSADTPDRLRGPNLTWAYIDEAALCPPDTWPIVLGRLRQGGQLGRCWLTTTPKGRNWVYDIAQNATVFRARTRDNPYLAPEFVELLERSYSGKFAAQELGGEFVTYEGLVYDEFDRTRHVRERKSKWERVVAGVDIGYTHPTAILVVGEDADGNVHVIDEFYRVKQLQENIIAEAKRLRDTYGISCFYVDPSAAEVIAAMRASGLDVRGAEHNIMTGIQVVKRRLASGLTISPRCVNTLIELECYAWRDGKPDKPEKGNDHAMDALRYALMGLEGTGGISVGVVRWQQSQRHARVTAGIALGRASLRLPWED